MQNIVLVEAAMSYGWQAGKQLGNLFEHYNLVGEGLLLNGWVDGWYWFHFVNTFKKEG